MALDDVPWSRIVHVYGRASEIPEAIRGLATDDHVAAARRLQDCLEHQDSLSQATPFATYFIVQLQLLKGGRARDQHEVYQLLTVLRRAARFQIECHSRPSPVLTWDFLLAEDRLWPPFKSKLDDEVLWEEWSPPMSEWLSGRF